MKHGHTVENYAQVVRDVYKLSKIQQMNYKGDEEQRSSQWEAPPGSENKRTELLQRATHLCADPYFYAWTRRENVWKDTREFLTRLPSGKGTRNSEVGL